MSDSISRVDIIKPKVALTFNGFADNQTMELLLAKLDESNMKATFFLRGATCGTGTRACSRHSKKRP
ncbi:hypothetical protein OL548_31865 [Lysinibacillus sp. MHQ-1]|nr:hypothetical protein OL548_31865 [Lysinibacillus sp. MHQ-1]